jgi:hypothetical protein
MLAMKGTYDDVARNKSKKRFASGSETFKPDWISAADILCISGTLLSRNEQIDCKHSSMEL